MSNIPPLINMSSNIFTNTQLLHEEPPEPTYLYEYDTYIMIGVNKYKCKKCDKVLQTITGIRTHYYTHDRPTEDDIEDDVVQLKKGGTSIYYSQTVDGRYMCNTCNKLLTSRSGILSHVNIHKPDHIKKYACNLCEYNTDNKTKIYVHIKFHMPNIKHKNIYKYITEHTDTFRNTHRENYKCSRCDYENRFKMHVDKHIRTEHLNK